MDVVRRFTKRTAKVEAHELHRTARKAVFKVVAKQLDASAGLLPTGKCKMKPSAIRSPETRQAYVAGFVLLSSNYQKLISIARTAVPHELKQIVRRIG